MPRKNGFRNRRDINRYLTFNMIRENEMRTNQRKQTLCSRCSLCTRIERTVTPEELGYDPTEGIAGVLVQDAECSHAGGNRILDMTKVKTISGYSAIMCTCGDDAVRVTCETCAHGELRLLRKKEHGCTSMRHVYICKDGPYAERCNNGLVLASYITCDGAEPIARVCENERR